MNFLSRLFGGKTRPKPASTNPDAMAEQQVLAQAPDVNIWEMNEDDSALVEAENSAPTKSRRRRNATRLIGFEHSDTGVTDLFDQTLSDADQKTLQFPVGWVLVVEGEGRGNCFCLASGLNQVGRGEENSITLNFGDTSISRKNHFAIVYDDEERKFILGHGGKSNIVRLNGKAVVSNEDLADGDTIKVGDTLLQLKTLCGPNFDWSEGENDEEQVNVAIA